MTYHPNETPEPLAQEQAGEMPEPDTIIDEDGNAYTFATNPSVVGASYYTADQMREAIRAATERAARLCDEHGEWYFENHDSQASQAADACAEAIRGTK